MCSVSHFHKILYSGSLENASMNIFLNLSGMSLPWTAEPRLK
jgi:hypothetical protein